MREQLRDNLGACHRLPFVAGAVTEGNECDEPEGQRFAVDRHISTRGGTVTPGDVGQPYAIDASGPVYDAARRAFQIAWGREPIDMGMGGSIPFIAEFAAAFPDAKILVTGVEDPGTQAHSINESLHLGVLERAATSEALFLEALGSDR